jgi:glycerol uptake facilitator protein
MDASLLRRVLAEFLGTALLVLFGAGSVVAALTLGGGALDYAGLGMISLAFGLVVALVIYALGTTSGAHINPAVTIGLAAVRRFKWADVGPYILAQALGAVLGALLIVAFVGDRATDFGIGLTAVADGVNWGQALVAEALGTFLLVFTIMAVAVDKRAPAGWAGFLIGLSVLTAILLIGPFTGGSINPARTFGPFLVNTFFGGSTPWADLWIYLVAPVVGGAVAAFCYEYVARPSEAEAAPITTPAAAGTPAAEGASTEAPQADAGIPEQARREAPTQPRTKT